jgi:hypothetical protein
MKLHVTKGITERDSAGQQVIPKVRDPLDQSEADDFRDDVCVALEKSSKIVDRPFVAG